ncbi:MAG: potassium transporter [Chloroflexi bacterium]|nr:potassium transporter [Chloroflexota bacterium]
MRQRGQRLPAPLRLVLGLLGLVTVGTVALMLPGMATRPLAWNEALFTATSALSVTGLSIIVPGTELTWVGQLVLLALIQIGGVGFMVVAVIIFRLLGRTISLTDRLALTDSFGLLAPRAILQLTQRVLITVVLIEGCGALLLWLHWLPLLGERAAFYAVFHAVSAFCNAGFELFTGLPGFADGLPEDGVTLTILAGLIVSGGLGIPVLGELVVYHRERRMSLHTRLTLVAVAVLLAIGTAGFAIGETRAGGVLAGLPPAEQLGLAAFHAVSARTAGFAAVPGFDQLTPATVLLMALLMFIGCAPASMGGGITTGTFVVLMLALWTYTRRMPSINVGGRSLAVGTVRKAAAVLTTSLLAVVLATWLLLVSHPQASLAEALFEVVSAFATCGLSLSFTGDLNLFGQAVIMLMMFWGRLGALTLVVAIAQPHASQRVSYPEEQILIG